jgi:hypothetical protein
MTPEVKACPALRRVYRELHHFRKREDFAAMLKEGWGLRSYDFLQYTVSYTVHTSAGLQHHV